MARPSANATPHEIGLAAKREAQEKYADRGLVAQALMAFYAYYDARRDAEEADLRIPSSEG